MPEAIEEAEVPEVAELTGVAKNAEGRSPRLMPKAKGVPMPKADCRGMAELLAEMASKTEMTEMAGVPEVT